MWEYLLQEILRQSSLSFYDIIAIQANFYYLTDEKFKCQDKIVDFAKRTSLEEATRLIQTANGCNTIAAEPRYNIDHIQYHTCFCQFQHPEMHRFLNLYKHFDNNILPFPGSLVDQPNYIMEIFSLIQRLKEERELKLNKKRQLEQNRKRK